MPEASSGSVAYDVGNIVGQTSVGDNPEEVDVDTVTGEVYVANHGSGTVTVFSSTTNAEVATVTVGANPAGLAYDAGNGEVYVVNVGSNTVSVISTSTNSVVDTIPVDGGDLWGIGYDSGNGDVYVMAQGSQTVEVISTATNEVVAGIVVGYNPETAVYDSANGDVYVPCEGSADVYVISGISNDVVATVPVGTEPTAAAYDSANGDVYVANWETDNASVISGTTNKVVATVPIGDAPEGAAYDEGNGDVYVADYDGNTLSVISGSTNTLVSTISTPSEPNFVQYDSATGAVYVSNYAADSVSEISTKLDVGALGTNLRGTPSTGSVVTGDGAGSGPEWMAYDPDSSDIYVADFSSDEVGVLSPATNTFVDTLTGFSAPYSAVYDGGNGEVYITNRDTGEVSVYTASTNAYLTEVSSDGSYPVGAAYDGANGDVYVANNGGGTVAVISGATNTEVVLVDVGSDPWGVAFDSANSDVYVTNLGSNTVSVISTASNTVVATISVGLDPLGVGYDAGNGDVYVSNDGGSTVSVISGTTNSVVATLNVGSGPEGAAFDGANGDVYVANSDSNNVSVISGTSNSVVASVTVGDDPTGVVYDSGTGEMFVSNVGSALVSAIPTIGSSVTSPAPTLDVGQSLLLEAPHDGQGSGGDLVTVAVSPTTGLSCVADPAALTLISGACQGSAAGSYTVTFTVEDALGTEVSTSTTVTVYPSLDVGTATLSRSSVDVGQTATVSVSPTGGSGTYSYFWSSLPTGCSSTNAPTLNCDPTTGSGLSYPISVSVTDSNDVTVASSSVSLTVYADPSAANIQSSLSSADVGESVEFLDSVSGGTGVYSYVWDQLPGCPSADNFELTCIPTVTGTALIYVEVTDSNGFTTASASDAFSVQPAPTIQPLSASTSALDVGQSFTLTTTATTGSGSPTYSWEGLPTGCLSANALTVSCSPASSGTFEVSAHVKDGNGMNVSSGSLTITVSPALSTPSVSISRSTMDVGQPVILTATVSGGTGGYSFAWTGLPTGCASSDSAALTCTPTGAGTFASVSVTVTDTNGASHASGASSLTVSPSPTVTTPSASVADLDVGQSTSLSSTATVGSGSPVYAWSGLPLGCLSSSALTLTCLPSAAGTYSVTVSVRDSNGMNVSSAALLLTVSALPTVTALTSSASGLDVGQVVTFTSTGTSGSGGLVFTWSGLPGGCNGANSWVLSCTPAQAGTSSVTLVVTDSNGGTAAWSTGRTVTVYADPTITTPSAAPASLDVTQSTVLTAVGTAPAGSPTYGWTGLPSGCSGTATLTVTCTPGSAAAGTYSVAAWVSDAMGLTVTSPSILLRISPLPTVSSFSASRLALDVGQSTLLTATGGSGSGSDTLAWTGLPAGCSSSDAWSVACAPSTTGTYTVSLTVTDGNGGSASAAAPVTLTVSSVPTADLPQASPSVLDGGQTLTLYAHATPGSGTPVYAWSGLPTGCLSADAAVVTCAAVPAGSYGIGYTVQDSNGVNVSSSLLFVTAAPALATPVLTASSSTLDVGQSTTLSVSVTGGTAPYTYTWSGLPVGCASVDTAALTCAPTSSGTSTVSVSVLDSSGATSTATLAITVAPALAVTLSASPSSGPTGTTVIVTATATGGAPTLDYTWFLNGSVVSGTTGSTLSLPAAKGGTYLVSVEVSDGVGAHVTSATATVEITGPSPTSTTSTGTTTTTTTTLGGMTNDLLIGILLLLVVVAVLLVVQLLRKERPPSREEPTPPRSSVRSSTQGTSTATAASPAWDEDASTPGGASEKEGSS